MKLSADSLNAQNSFTAKEDARLTDVLTYFITNDAEKEIIFRTFIEKLEMAIDDTNKLYDSVLVYVVVKS